MKEFWLIFKKQWIEEKPFFLAYSIFLGFLLIMIIILSGLAKLLEWVL